MHNIFLVSSRLLPCLRRASSCSLFLKPIRDEHGSIIRTKSGYKDLIQNIIPITITKINYSKLLVTNIILISNQVHRTQQWLLQRLQHTRISSRLITTTSNNFMPQMGWLIIIIQPPFLSFCRSLMMSTMMFQLLLQKQLSKVLMLSLSR